VIVRLARASLVLFLATAVQIALLDRLHPEGVHPDLLALLPAAAGAGLGAARGAAFGFAAGLLADLFAPTPFGLGALVGTVTGYAAGSVAEGTSLGAPAFVIALVTGATAAELIGYAILSAVFGQPGVLLEDLPRVLAIELPSAVVLALPACRLMRLAWPPETASRSWDGPRGRGPGHPSGPASRVGGGVR
jgi:rod shape-determining protein MreD